MTSGVYIVRAGNGLAKIGWSRDVDGRIQELQGSCPAMLRLVRVLETTNPGVEPALHRLLHAQRRHGEWFELTDDDILAINELEIATLPVQSELTRRREALGLSRAELAKRVGVSTPTVWRWETEGRQPIPAVAKTLEQTLARLEKRQAPAPSKPTTNGRGPGVGNPNLTPERLPTAPPSKLDAALERQHALAEAEWARRDGDLAEARRWEQIAASLGAERVS
jgi:transcriptional regulator with XRE-family HTH domain